MNPLLTFAELPKDNLLKDAQSLGVSLEGLLRVLELAYSYCANNIERLENREWRAVPENVDIEAKRLGLGFNPWGFCANNTLTEFAIYTNTITCYYPLV